MNDVNVLVLGGRLCDNPKTSVTQGGQQVLSFRLASNRKGRNGDEPCFIECVCFGKLAEVCAQWLFKGRAVIVQGALRMEQWQDRQTGQQRTGYRILASDIVFTDMPQAQQSQQATPQQPPSQWQGQTVAQPVRQAAPPMQGDGFGQPTAQQDDLPF